MRYRVDRKGHIKVYCLNCNKEMKLKDLLKIKNNFYCIFCKTRLGGMWDLPREVRKLLIK